MNRRLTLVLLVATALIIPAIAAAHPGHGAHDLSLWSGLWHPFTGLDHLIAAVAVGAWAAFADGRRWQLPATFVGAMIMGAALTAVGVAAPGLHALSAVSVFGLGLMVATAGIWPQWSALVVVGAVGLVHGGAHMAGSAGSATMIAVYISAMVVSTAALHGAGLWLASRYHTTTPIRAPRVAGAAVAVAGVACTAIYFMGLH